MDYWIGDETILPGGLNRTFSEKLWRLPRCWLSYQPPATCPDPLRQNHAAPVVFGSFNNRLKISERTLALWSRVLHEVPDSTMMMVCRAGGTAAA